MVSLRAGLPAARQRQLHRRALGPLVLRMRPPDPYAAWLRKHLHPRQANRRGSDALKATNIRVRRILWILMASLAAGHQGPKEIGCSAAFLEWLTDPILNGGGALTDFG